MNETWEKLTYLKYKYKDKHLILFDLVWSVDNQGLNGNMRNLNLLSNAQVAGERKDQIKFREQYDSMGANV